MKRKQNVPVGEFIDLPLAPVGPKPTQAQLEEAFKKVQPATHWKDRIDALIDPADEHMVYDAVIHFTATVPRFTKTKEGKLRVRAAGYRNGPCAEY